MWVLSSLLLLGTHLSVYGKEVSKPTELTLLKRSETPVVQAGRVNEVEILVFNNSDSEQEVSLNWRVFQIAGTTALLRESSKRPTPSRLLPHQKVLIPLSLEIGAVHGIQECILEVSENGRKIGVQRLLTISDSYLQEECPFQTPGSIGVYSASNDSNFQKALKGAWPGLVELSTLQEVKTFEGRLCILHGVDTKELSMIRGSAIRGLRILCLSADSTEMVDVLRPAKLAAIGRGVVLEASSRNANELSNSPEAKVEFMSQVQCVLSFMPDNDTPTSAERFSDTPTTQAP